MTVWNGFEKATEIGIHEITPIICDHLNAKFINWSSRKNYSICAETILTNILPKSMSLFLWRILKQNFDGQKFIAHCEETDKNHLKWSKT